MKKAVIALTVTAAIAAAAGFATCNSPEPPQTVYGPPPDIVEPVPVEPASPTAPKPDPNAILNTDPEPVVPVDVYGPPLDPDEYEE